jgi:hypothetical protein
MSRSTGLNVHGRIAEEDLNSERCHAQDVINTYPNSYGYSAWPIRVQRGKR